MTFAGLSRSTGDFARVAVHLWRLVLLDPALVSEAPPGVLLQEAQLLRQALPPDSELPDVLIQIPTFNEGELVCRLADAIGAARLAEGPSSRPNLRRQSSTAAWHFAEKAMQRVAASETSTLPCLHRLNRYGFKAGALAAGLEISDHEFVADLRCGLCTAEGLSRNPAFDHCWRTQQWRLFRRVPISLTPKKAW